VTFFVDMRIEK